MARGRKRQTDEQVIARVVRDCGVPESRQREFICYARELYRAMDRKPAGFERLAARLLRKWLRRGLQGRLLWEVGAAVIAWRFPPEGGRNRG